MKLAKNAIHIEKIVIKYRKNVQIPYTHTKKALMCIRNRHLKKIEARY